MFAIVQIVAVNMAIVKKMIIRSGRFFSSVYNLAQALFYDITLILAYLMENDLRISISG